MPIICEKWTARRSNTLHGFADVLLEATHLRIHDVAVHSKNGRRWAQLPGRPMIDRDGVVMRDEKNKTRYSPILEFTDREASDKFTRGVIDAVLQAHPDAFAGEDGA